MSLDRYFLPILCQGQSVDIDVSTQSQLPSSSSESNESSSFASVCEIAASEHLWHWLPDDHGVIDKKPVQPSLEIYAPQPYGSSRRDFNKI